MFSPAVNDQLLFFVLLLPVIVFFSDLCYMYCLSVKTHHSSAFCLTVYYLPIYTPCLALCCPSVTNPVLLSISVSLYAVYVHTVTVSCCLSMTIPLLLFMLPVLVSTVLFLLLMCLSFSVPYFVVLLLSVS
jgi:hypothetical protein